MNCKQIKKRLPLYHDRILPEKLIKTIDAHCAECADCGRELQQYGVLIKVTAGASEFPKNIPVPREFLAELKTRTPEASSRSAFSRNAWKYAAAACALIIIGLFLLSDTPRRTPLEELEMAKLDVIDQEMERIPPVPVDEEEDLAAYMTRMAALADYDPISNLSDTNAVAVTYATDDPKIKIVWIYRQKPETNGG